MNQTGQVMSQQTILKMEKAICLQMETLIPKMQEMADKYNIAGDKSPYRNVLNVAVDPASDVEVTKNFILYQLGRDRRSPWRKTDSKGEKLGLALVEAIKRLDDNAKRVVKEIGEDMDTESGQHWLQQAHRQAHRRLMQLYLGNLVRYQVYLTFRENERKARQNR